MREWAEVIKDLNDDQIRYGIDVIRKKNTWPPSIAEFYEACMCQSKYATAAHRPFPVALPRPPADKKLGGKIYGKIKCALRGGHG